MGRDAGYGEAMRHLRTLFAAGTTGAGSDAELVERIAAGGGAAARAFEAVVERHGPMVWGVCRSILDDRHAAEDAFQATFLVLARRAGALRLTGTLGGWLHGVAVTVARRARADAAKRAKREAPLGDQVEKLSGDAPLRAAPEDVAAVHEELSRLEAAQRQAIVLCHLQGYTHEQAAIALGWPVGTVRSRLARGRERLRSRLIRRGVGPAIGLGAAADSLGGVPPALVGKAVAAGMGWISGGLAPGVGTVPAAVAALAGGVVTSMVTTKLATVGGAAVLGLAAFLGATGTLSGQDDGARPGPSEGEGPPVAVRDGELLPGQPGEPRDASEGHPRDGHDMRRSDRDPNRIDEARGEGDMRPVAPARTAEPARAIPALPASSRAAGDPFADQLLPARGGDRRPVQPMLPGMAGYDVVEMRAAGDGGDARPMRTDGFPADVRPAEVREPATQPGETPHELAVRLRQARSRLDWARQMAAKNYLSRQELQNAVTEVEVIEARVTGLRDEYRDELDLLKLRIKANELAGRGAEARLRGAQAELTLHRDRQKAGVGAASGAELARAETLFLERQSELDSFHIAREELELRIRQVERRLKALEAAAEAEPAVAPTDAEPAGVRP